MIGGFNNLMQRASKRMSYLLRHHPEEASLDIDEYGYVSVNVLLTDLGVIPEELQSIVDTDDKKRFVFNHDKTKIKCAQGHSIQVRLELPESIPPSTLYHGTAAKFLPAIKVEGIRPMTRQYVHLTDKKDTAFAVGRRHGKPVILTIQTAQMIADGHVFYLTENNVWLTATVPSKYMGGEGEGTAV